MMKVNAIYTTYTISKYKTISISELFHSELKHILQMYVWGGGGGGGGDGHTFMKNWQNILSVSEYLGNKQSIICFGIIFI